MIASKPHLLESLIIFHKKNNQAAKPHSSAACLSSFSRDLISPKILLFLRLSAGFFLVVVPDGIRHTFFFSAESDSALSFLCSFSRTSQFLKNVTNSRKCLYNNETALGLSCLFLTSDICFYSSGLIFHFPFSIFNFPREGVGLSCDSLA